MMLSAALMEQSYVSRALTTEHTKLNTSRPFLFGLGRFFVFRSGSGD